MGRVSAHHRRRLTLFIGVSGLIGVGKTTFTTNLADHLGDGWATAYEPVETNPYLDDFYADIRRWTFNMQMFLLAQRFRQHQEVLWDPRHRAGGGIVQDRTIYEDTVFARMHREDGLMDDRDWQTYIDHFEVMKGFLRYPDVIVYLRADPAVALERIQARGREAENGMELAYLERLHEGYQEFADEMRRYTVVITVDWSQFGDVADVARVIKLAAGTNQKFLRSLRRI
jgi:deoxyadenosine/deoxycytidine kinase